MKMEPMVSSETSAYFIHLPMKMEPIVSSETSAYFIHLPMKMEPIVSSETSAIRTQTPGNYPKRNKLQIAPYFRLNVFAEGCFSGAADKM